MSPISLLRAALTAQVLLGVSRFLAPYAGVAFPTRLWLIHPILGGGIAVAALWLLRDRPGVPSTGARTAARFAALVPLALGLAKLAGIASGLPLVLAHMAVGLAAIKLLDTALVDERMPSAEPAQATR